MKKRKIKKENENSFIRRFSIWISFILILFAFIWISCYLVARLVESSQIPGTILFEIAGYVSSFISSEIDRNHLFQLTLILSCLLCFFGRRFFQATINLREKNKSLRKDVKENVNTLREYLYNRLILALEGIAYLLLIATSIFLFIAVMVFPKIIAQDVILFINVFVATSASIGVLINKIKAFDPTEQ